MFTHLYCNHACAESDILPSVVEAKFSAFCAVDEAGRAVRIVVDNLASNSFTKIRQPFSDL